MENWGLSLTLYQMVSCLGTLVCCEQLYKKHGSGDKQGLEGTDTSIVSGVNDVIRSAQTANWDESIVTDNSNSTNALFWL